MQRQEDNRKQMKAAGGEGYRVVSSSLLERRPVQIGAMAAAGVVLAVLAVLALRWLLSPEPPRQQLPALAANAASTPAGESSTAAGGSSGSATAKPEVEQRAPAGLPGEERQAQHAPRERRSGDPNVIGGSSPQAEQPAEDPRLVEQKAATRAWRSRALDAEKKASELARRLREARRERAALQEQLQAEIAAHVPAPPPPPPKEEQILRTLAPLYGTR